MYDGALISSKCSSDQTIPRGLGSSAIFITTFDSFIDLSHGGILNLLHRKRLLNSFPRSEREFFETVL